MLQNDNDDNASLQVPAARSHAARIRRIRVRESLRQILNVVQADVRAAVRVFC